MQTKQRYLVTGPKSGFVSKVKRIIPDVQILRLPSKNWIEQEDGTEPQDMVTIRCMICRDGNIPMRFMNKIESEFEIFCSFGCQILPTSSDESGIIRFTISVDAQSHSQIQDQIESWIEGYIAATDGLSSTAGFNIA